MPADRVVAAIAQVAPVFLDLDASVARAVTAIGEAAASRARVVAFAETWLPGYPAWIDDGVPWDNAVAKATYGRLLRNSVTVPGPATEALSRAARRNRVHVVIGINERDDRFSGGTIYNSLLYIGDDGEILGVHRKLVPTLSERVVWGQGDGSTLTVVDTPHGRLGGLICWEHWMPLARYAMHAKGERIHVAAWPDMPEIHHLASRTYAFEGRCFVLCTGLYLPGDAIPAGIEAYEHLAARAASGPLYPGGSAIAGPNGDWVAEPVFGREQILVAELELAAIDGEFQALDVAGHYGRPDVFRLEVDETARVAMVSRPLRTPGAAAGRA